MKENLVLSKIKSSSRHSFNLKLCIDLWLQSHLLYFRNTCNRLMNQKFTNKFRFACLNKIMKHINFELTCLYLHRNYSEIYKTVEKEKQNLTMLMCIFFCYKANSFISIHLMKWNGSVDTAQYLCFNNIPQFYGHHWIKITSKW